MTTRHIAAALFAAVFSSAASGQTFFFNNPGAIPDGVNPPGTFGPPRIMTATSNSPNPIQDVAVSITMSHTWVGDLRIRLAYTPTGSATTVTAFVINRVGAVGGSSFGSGADINGTFTFLLGATPFQSAVLSFNPLTFGIYAPFNNNFDGTTSPVEFADFFRGLPGTGTWTLTFDDAAFSDAGTVTNASIALQARSLPCLADFNTDGVVNTVDLVFFLGRFGNACTP